MGEINSYEKSLICQGEAIQSQAKRLKIGNDLTVHHSINQPSLDLLDTLKAHQPTRLAFKVSKKPGQRTELLTAALSIGAMVHFLSVRGRVEMLVERLGGIEALVADVTLPVVTVVGIRTNLVLHIRFLGILNHPFHDKATWVRLLDHAQDCVSVQHGGVGASAMLEVVDHATCSGKAVLAEGAGEVCSAVNFRVAMLCRRVRSDHL